MTCKHNYEDIRKEDVPNIDFHKTRDGFDSKRWRTLRCKKCSHLHTEPVV